MQFDPGLTNPYLVGLKQFTARPSFANSYICDMSIRAEMHRRLGPLFDYLLD